MSHARVSYEYAPFLDHDTSSKHDIGPYFARVDIDEVAMFCGLPQVPGSKDFECKAMNVLFFAVGPPASTSTRLLRSAGFCMCPGPRIASTRP